ncbi:MAG: serine hydrolase [Sphingomonas sp.]|uniref:serine hydrolase n=1 Tax=Sphingomonas sp. TaxID=28214 RepID=UPI001AD320FF|nr:serine hydrolase [Sphingomonas sp.]MBN8815447.1 serine hydrolase [Sphingomonas sp.]
MRGLIGLLLLAATPATAQTPPPPPSTPATTAADPAIIARAGELPSLIAGTTAFDSFFAPSFQAAIPKQKWDTLIVQLTGQLGKPLALESFTAANALSGTARVKFERGVANIQLAIEPTAPHRVSALLFAGFEIAGDSVQKLATAFRALPGNSGFGIYALDGNAQRLLAGYNPDRAAPLGSAFKLWVLGELTREVAGGERKWAEVVPVGPASLPSGITQSWPAGSPVTIQTLATLMISISDNTATDTLVALERRKLDAFVARVGTPDLAPMMTTRQMFAIKSSANADLAEAWAKASPADRRKLLDANAARLASTPVDVALFATGRPIAIDTLEWFATPAQTAGVLDWLRTKGGDTALALLAINPGADPATRAKFDYVGFKGGSEPGVLTLNYLVRRKDGRWMAIVGNWSRKDAGVDTGVFAQMMTRALILAAAMP